MTRCRQWTCGRCAGAPRQRSMDNRGYTLIRLTTDRRSLRHQGQASPGSYLNWKSLSTDLSDRGDVEPIAEVTHLLCLELLGAQLAEPAALE